MNQKPMTPRELRRIIDRMDISQQELARRLDINPRTVRCYLSGEMKIPRRIDYAVRWVEMQQEEAA